MWKLSMSLLGISTMIVVLAIVWGGFAFALSRAIKIEKNKQANNG